jgi:hypothetical protein
MPSWINSARGHVPEDAFKAGRDENGIIYVGRAKHKSDLLPGKVVPAHSTAYVCYDGLELAKDEYQVLCGYAFYWVPVSAHGQLPQRAVSAGQTDSGEVLYVGRVSHRGVDVVGKVTIIAQTNRIY